MRRHAVPTDLGPTDLRPTGLEIAAIDVSTPLIELGLKPSPKFKEILDAVYDLQLDGKITDLVESDIKPMANGIVNHAKSEIGTTTGL